MRGSRSGNPFRLRYVVRLVFFMGGNIDTLMDILEDNAKERRFYPAMQKLGEQDSGARRFFDNDFYSTGFSETRQQIKTRLYEIISKPELMAMFAAGQNKLSIFDCLQQRKIVLINTAMPQLGSKASQLLGRYFIAVTLNAAFARVAIPKSQWTPAYPHHRRVSRLCRRGKDAGAFSGSPVNTISASSSLIKICSARN